MLSHLKIEKREKVERKEIKREKMREIEREREKRREQERKRCPGSIIINLHSILKKKNYIYWQKCSKFQKVAREPIDIL